MMRLVVLITVVGMLIGAAHAFSETGYKRSPWGSKSWDGPGKPPHWSSRPPAGNRPADPGWGIRPPSHKPGKWGRVYYYEKSVSPPTIIIEQERQPSVSLPEVQVQRQISPVRCGGRTVTRKDPATGELIIEYVSSSRTCPE